MTGPRRRPREGGYARGAETRERIIEAAFGVFAEQGYVGASTRLIAAQAGVNPPALQYYFDSKEGLHQACGQAIVERVMKSFAPAMEEARAALASGRGTDVREALGGLMDRLVELALPQAGEGEWRRFLGNCQTQHSGPAFDVVERDFTAPLKALVTALVASALGVKAEDERARLRALLLLGQLSIIQGGADTTRDTLGWPDFAGARRELLRSTFRDHVLRLLDTPLAHEARPSARGGR